MSHLTQPATARRIPRCRWSCSSSSRRARPPAPTPAPPGSPTAVPTASPPASATRGRRQLDGRRHRRRQRVSVRRGLAVDASSSSPDAGDVGSIADVVVAARSGRRRRRSRSGRRAWRRLDLDRRRRDVGRASRCPKAARSIGSPRPVGRSRPAHRRRPTATARIPRSSQVQVRAAAGGWTAAPFDPILCAGGLPQGAAVRRRAR